MIMMLLAHCRLGKDRFTPGLFASRVNDEPILMNGIEISVKYPGLRISLPKTYRKCRKIYLLLFAIITVSATFTLKPSRLFSSLFWILTWET